MSNKISTVILGGSGYNKIVISPASVTFCLLVSVYLLIPHPAYALDPLFVAGEYRDTIEELAVRYIPTMPPGKGAAWVHQESRWNKNAVSPVGARGPLQIMPATARDIRITCKIPELDLTNMISSLKGGFCYGAQVRRWVGRMATVADQDEAMWRGYNGGAGYVLKERKAAVKAGLTDTVAANLTAFCAAFRSAASCKENLGYVPSILKWYTKFYRSWS